MSRKKARKKTSSQKAHRGSAIAIRNWLQLGQLQSEKCELKEAQLAYSMALEAAKRSSDLRSRMEAISGLLRLAGEAQDERAIEKWDLALDALTQAYSDFIPPMVWYCKGTVALYHKNYRLSQKFGLRFIEAVRVDPELGDLAREEQIVKGWSMIANTLLQRGYLKRSASVARILLSRYEAREFRGANGILYLLSGTIDERNRNTESAMQWYQKAHGSFLAEHNWYYHLYVLYGYARISRLNRNYSQAYWYLDLMSKAASGPEFGLLRREVSRERQRLEKDAIDLLVDSRQGVIKTRESSPISLRKQYVLLHILEELTQAHSRPGVDNERGLTKAEIIERVWNEDYRPEAHDNKLYYNINRLRKLIEPDVHKPRYLLNWKEGYRLAPGLRVQFIGGEKVRNSARNLAPKFEDFGDDGPSSS